MSKHTPGPWHVGIGNGQGSIFPDIGRTRLEAGGTALYPIASINSGWDAVEDTANARLIAAAPELLEALTMVRDADDNHKLDGLPIIPLAARAKIGAAIAKATGETP